MNHIVPKIYYTSYRRKRLLKNNQQVHLIFLILACSWYEPCVEVGLAWSSKIGSINLIPKNVKIAETQNQTKPRILVDRNAPYEHFLPLATWNGFVGREQCELQILSILVIFQNVLWYFDDYTKFGKVSIVNGEPILSCKHLENNFYYSKIIF